MSYYWVFNLIIVYGLYQDYESYRAIILEYIKFLIFTVPLTIILIILFINLDFKLFILFTFSAPLLFIIVSLIRKKIKKYVLRTT